MVGISFSRSSIRQHIHIFELYCYIFHLSHRLDRFLELGKEEVHIHTIYHSKKICLDKELEGKEFVQVDYH